MFPGLFEVPLGKPELLLVLLSWEVGAGAARGLSSALGEDLQLQELCEFLLELQGK